MRKLNRWLYGSGLLFLVMFLSGCVKTGADGQPTGEGFVYNFLVLPMSNAITYLVDNFNWNYGWAIIFITIIVRIIILPLGLHQSKKSFIQTEKMQAIKPQVDVAQAKMKQASTREEQMAAQAELQKIYKENNVSMVGGIGCLRYTKGIATASFLGMNLGQPNMILVALAGLAYLAQGYISMIGIPEEQKKTMKSMLIVSPLMIVFMSFSSPAGVALYWVVGGIFTCIQSAITNILLRPRIKKQVQEELKNNPPKQVVTPIKDVTPKETNKATQKTNQPKANGNKGRNAGKQKRK